MRWRPVLQAAAFSLSCHIMEGIGQRWINFCTMKFPSFEYDLFLIGHLFSYYRPLFSSLYKVILASFFFFPLKVYIKE